MASIQRIVSPRTGDVSYRAQVRVKGRSESSTFTTRKKAEAWANRLESAIEDHRYFPHAAATRTGFDKVVEDYAKTVLPEFDEVQRTARTRHLEWWAKRFAGLSIAEVTGEQISKARDACAAQTFTRGKPRTDEKTGETKAPREFKRSGATVNRYVATLSHVLSFAVKERRLLDRNPVTDIARKKESRGRTRFLSDAERSALLNACAKSQWHPLHALVLLAITTGARRSELLSLKWADVDMKAGRALVRESKNDEQRTLPLAGKALEALRALKADEAKRVLKAPGSPRSEYVFPNPSEHTSQFEYFDSYWYAALGVAGIEDFRFHDLRHTTASMLAAQGASLLEIADVLGHKDLSMVKRYSHLVVDHKAKVIEKMIAEKGL